MTDRAGLRQRLHELHALGVDLDQGQQVTGAHRLVQVHHLGRRRRARLAGVLVVHILGVDELLPHRPDGGGGLTRTLTRTLTERRRCSPSCWRVHSHVAGGAGLGRGGRQVALHDLIETTVPNVLGQLKKKKSDI